MTQNSPYQRRKRGVILTHRGWQRLQVAEQETANQTNSGRAYTLEQLGERTGLSPNTITKVRRRQQPVDRQTLESYFSALNLPLTSEDYISLDSDFLGQFQLRVPLKGQVPLDSPLYVARPPHELLAHEEILQPGTLIRIKAPRQFGKTSLMARMLQSSREKGLRGTVLSLQLADTSVFKDLRRFLRWFCAVITRDLRFPDRPDESWDEVFGSSYNCTNYFEKHLLTPSEDPIVLALDDVDIIFNHPEIATDFFAMIRAWYEKARYGGDTSIIWQRLRLVMAHSTELNVPLNCNQSPFNVGLLIELAPFTREQVQDLTQRYGLHDSELYADELMELLGGIPYLTQLALHTISTQEMTLTQLNQTAIAADGIFGSYLLKQLAHLQQHPDLLGTLKHLLFSTAPSELNPVHVFKLHSMGLVRLHQLQPTASCKLYQQYFSQILQLSS